MPERQVTILAKLTDKLSGPLKGIVKVFGKVGRAAVAAGRLARASLRGVGRAIAFVKRSLFSLKSLLLVGAFAGIIKVFADFERGLANVATLVDTSEVSMRQLGDAVLAVSRETGEGLGTLNEALFDIISAGVDANKAYSVLLQASELAKGGMTSTAAAAKGLVSIMNAYGLAAEDARAVSDSLFTAQKQGITTVELLSRGIGKVAPVAKLAGLSIDEMLAAVAALTKSGVSTIESIGGLRSIIQALIKPTEQAIETARRLRIEFNTSRLKGGNFIKFLQEVAEKTGLNESLMTKLFTNSRAFAAVANLAANKGKFFADAMDEMGRKTGATDEAVKKVAATLSDKISILLAEIKAFFVIIGEAAKPFIEKVIEKVRAFVSDLSSRKNEIQAVIKGIAQAIGQIGRVIASIFREGDVLRFIINVVSGGIQGAVKLLIAAIPTFVQTAKLIGRAFGQAIIGAVIGSTQEALARKLAGGKRGVARLLLKPLGLDEDALNTLERQGRALINAEKNILSQEAALAKRRREPGVLDTFRDPRLGAATAPVSTAVVEQRLKDAKADFSRLRDELAGDVFSGVSEADSALLKTLAADLVVKGKGIFIDFLKDLPEGMSAPTKETMGKLGDLWGEEWSKAIAEGIALDEAAKKKAAEETGKNLGEGLGEGIGTGVKAVVGDKLDVNTVLLPIQYGIEKLTISMTEFRRERSQLAQQVKGGFISSDEAKEREIILLAAIRKEMALIEEKLTSLREAASKQVFESMRPEIEAAEFELAKFRKQMEGIEKVSGTFLLGLTAGITGTVEKFADLRAAGMEVGVTLASSLGDGLVEALQKGTEGLREFASDFLRTIAQIILKALIFQAVMAGLKAIGGPFASIGAGIGTAVANKGGILMRRRGGPVPGPRVNRDVVPALLTPGEFVHNRESVEHYGSGVMEAIRRRLIPRGILSPYAQPTRTIPLGRHLQSGGMPSTPVAGGPTQAFIVSDESTLDKLLAGGQQAFRRYMRDNAPELRAALGIT